MSARPQTIEIFLPGGDPRGIRVAEITTRIVQVVDVPRSLLGEFNAMPESGFSALYFLLSDADGMAGRRVYVGRSDRLRSRLETHHRSKEFWERALILLVSTKGLTQAHAAYLEWQSIREATRAGRYIVENANGGSKPHVPRSLQAACSEIFETGQVLVATLGHPIFEALGVGRDQPGGAEVLYCKRSGADGRGLYTPEGFVVLKGSSGRSQVVPQLVDTPDARARQNLIDAGVVSVAGDRMTFTKDHLFGSPSSAATALMARTANGWKEWETKDGTTLDEKHRGGKDRPPRRPGGRSP